MSVAAFLQAAEAAHLHWVDLPSVPGFAVQVRELSPMDALQVQGLLASIAARAFAGAGSGDKGLTVDDVRHLQQAAALGVVAVRTADGQTMAARVVVGEPEGPGDMPVDRLMLDDLGLIYEAAVRSAKRAADRARSFRHGSEG